MQNIKQSKPCWRTRPQKSQERIGQSVGGGVLLVIFIFNIPEGMLVLGFLDQNPGIKAEIRWINTNNQKPKWTN